MTSRYVYEVGLRCKLNIFPLIADSGVDLPYAVYQRLEQQPQDNKDGVGFYTSRYTVRFVSSTYQQSVDMLTKYTQEIYTGTTDFGVEIQDVKVEDAGEEWSDGCFIQSINLTIEYNLI